MVMEPPRFRVDFRIATSAVEGLRFELATRVADLGELIGQLETLVIRASARRAQVRARLRQNEANRGQVLAARQVGHPRDVESVFGAGAGLCAELAALDERIAAVEARVEALRAGVASLRAISATLREAELRGSVIDEQVVLAHRASRGLSQLIHEDSTQLVEDVLDGPVQELADLTVRLEVVHRLLVRRLKGAAAEFSHCRAAVQRAAVAFDRLAFEIRPEALDVAGVAPALRELSRRVPAPAVCRFELIGEARRLRGPVEIAIFRLVQEAVRNALMHGRAERVDVVLSLHPDRAVVMVRDDGEGFDVVATEARLGRTGSFGMLIMRERVEALGGACKLRSAPGAGTEVRAMLPLAGGRPEPS